MAEIYKAWGERGLRDLPNLGKRIVGRITRWLREEELDKGAVADQVAYWSVTKARRLDCDKKR